MTRELSPSLRRLACVSGLDPRSVAKSNLVAVAKWAFAVFQYF